MNEYEDFCTKCEKPPTNPRAMLCGHIFCLNPCLLPPNSNQTVVQCPICFIETDVIHLEAVAQVKPPEMCTRLANPVSESSCSTPKPCQHSSQTVCPLCVGNFQSEILAQLMKKVTDLQSKRTALQLLKTQITDKLPTRKHRLLEEVSSVADQLFNVSETSLKKTQLFLESTSAKEKTAVQKMESNLLKLKKMRNDLLETARRVVKNRATRSEVDIPSSQRSKQFIILTKLRQSAKLFRREFQTFRSLLHSCETSGLWNLVPAQNFVTIQLELQNFHLVISGSACAFEKKPPIPPLAQAKCLPNPPLKRKLTCDPDRNRIFVGDLPLSIKHYDLQEYFSQFGVVEDVVLLGPSKEQTPRRCGFVGFREWASVRKALGFHPHLLNGALITVSLPKSKRMRYAVPTHPVDRYSHLSDVGSDNHPDSDPIEDATIQLSNQNKLFVGQLHPRTTKSDLTAYFSKFGPVKNVQILTNRINSPSGNFGYVTFAESGAFIRDVLNTRHLLYGRYLNVKAAKTPAQPHLAQEKPPVQLELQKPSHKKANCATNATQAGQHCTSSDKSSVQNAREDERVIDFVTLADNEAARRRPLTTPLLHEGRYLNAKRALGVQWPRRWHAERARMLRKTVPTLRSHFVHGRLQRTIQRRLPSRQM
uniref:Heterogeneous nuclear ribonucleoprotein A1 n=1 Tax=Schistocephalus solidus TaxID=70667 RepID=A0A0X3PZC0_SCHSO